MSKPDDLHLGWYIITTIDEKEYKILPNPTPKMLNDDPIFDAIWEVIKEWDINVPEYYAGYMGGTGSHVTLIYDAIMKAKIK
jgi:hypothetical protein